mmetsp:Transcript_7465/g.21231  ORF Transcript_7465/g.21231 Transcript_7465/m.21231 type:complete len:363 (-) Transcript_7465:37-1125(-)
MGALGSTCVRDCVRSAHEGADDELLPVSSALSSSSLPRTIEPPIRQLGHFISPGTATGVVPPVANWAQVLHTSGDRSGGNRRDGVGFAAAPKETPRFDEVRASPRSPKEQATPRDTVGGEFRTPRRSPRDTASLEDAKVDEISYEGMYLGTLKHGHGKLRMAGSTYDGEFQSDQKHGLGILTWDDGRQYRGGFISDKFHGHAVMTWPDGRSYIGNYEDDRKHGAGTFSWQDGRRYEGQWFHGKRHGVGTYTNAKGLTRRGTWQLDRPITWEVVAGRHRPLDPQGAVAVPAPSSAFLEDSQNADHIKLVETKQDAHRARSLDKIVEVTIAQVDPHAIASSAPRDCDREEEEVEIDLEVQLSKS